jgi:hypothetical protein
MFIEEQDYSFQAKDQRREEKKRTLVNQELVDRNLSQFNHYMQQQTDGETQKLKR